MRRTLVASSLAVMLLGTGCFNHLLYDSASVPEPTPVYDRWQHHIVWGLATLSPPVDFRALCPYGVAQVEDYISFANFLVSFFTLFLYTPSNLEVYCAEVKEVVMAPPAASPPPAAEPPGVVVLPPAATEAAPVEPPIVEPR